MEAQLVSIQDTLYVVAFVLGAMFIMLVAILWEVTRNDDKWPDSEVDNSGTDASVSAPGVSGNERPMVQRRRTVYPSGEAQSLLDRQREAEDNR